MNVRNVQRSGNTYYIYLPASWCKQNNISPNSKVSLETSSEGNLLIMPISAAERDLSLFLKLNESDMGIINKFIVASYLNPAKSFRIKVDRKISSLDILDQKKLLGGIEVVEFGENQIMCESSITVEDPNILLKTMVKKVANMLHIMIKGGSSELLDRYEEEIDRSNMLITKSVISSLMFRKSFRLRNIDLFYISVLSKNLEGFADNLPNLKKNYALQKHCLEIMTMLLKMLENITLEGTVFFSKEAENLSRTLDSSDNSGKLIPLKNRLEQLIDTLIDWAVTAEVDRIR